MRKQPADQHLHREGLIAQGPEQGQQPVIGGLFQCRQRSMILLGISGSFVLILMGNYELIVIDAVNALDLRILLPVALGAVVGLVAFSHFLSWIFRKFRAETISTLTGFILGSLLILWPWKTAVWRLDADGAAVVRNGKKLVEGYAYNLPPVDEEFWRALAMMAAGILTIWVTEKLAARNDSPQ